jgi:hypothetical protein
MQEINQSSGRASSSLEKTTSNSDFLSRTSTIVQREVKSSSRNAQIESELAEKLERISLQKEALNSENLNLKVELDKLRKDFTRLSEFQFENEKLKKELDEIREENRQEMSKLNTRLEYELKVQAENFKIRARHDESQREEMRVKHANELSAAKIRFENELSKQNGLMQLKYDGLKKEINSLGQVISKLQGEKNDLISQIKYERELNKQLLRKNELLAAQKSNER